MFNERITPNINHKKGNSRGLVFRTLSLQLADPGFESDKSHW